MSKLIFQQDELPSLNSSYMNKLAQYFYQVKLSWHDARRPLEQKWRQCDEAYLCFRYLPDSGAIDYLDDSEFGETDVFDNVNKTAIAIMQRMLPKDGSYLDTSIVDEDEEDADAVKDFLIYKHRRAGSRRQLAKFLKMLIVRGDAGILWTHEERTRMRRLTKAESLSRVTDYLKIAGLSAEDADKFGRARIQETIYSGPSVRVIDSHDYFLSPIADLSNRRSEPVILQTYRFLEDLQNEFDEYGNHIYENLDGLMPTQAYDLYARQNDGAARIRSMQIMGIQPETNSQYGKLIPVYICYFPYLKFEGKEFYDTYFHFALNGNTKSADGGDYRSGPRMIRIEENPSDSGHLHFLPDTYIDFFTNVAYGLSGVEKALTTFRQKNVMQALMFNAAVATQFPAYLGYSDAFKDGEASFSPGYFNEIANTGIPLDQIIRPVPTPERGLQLGLQDLRFMSDELRAKMGTDGLEANNPAREITKSPTATEITHNAASGNIFIEEQTEKFSDTITEYYQGSFEMMKQQTPPPADGYLDYEKPDGPRRRAAKLAYSVFMKDRTIEITGAKGLIDRNQRTQAVMQMMQAAAGIAQFLPNPQALIAELYYEACKLTGVKISDAVKQTPEQIAAGNPQVQMQAIQQGIQQIALAQHQQQPQIGQQHPAGPNVLAMRPPQQHRPGNPPQRALPRRAGDIASA